MKRPFHPIAIAAYPVLSLYAANQGLIPFTQVVAPLLAVIAFALFLWLLAAALLRSWLRGALVASAATLLFFMFGHLQNALNLAVSFTFWLWIPLLTIGLLLAGWKWKEADQITRAMNAVALILILFPIFGITLGRTEKAAPQGTVFQKTKARSTPDIIHIVLDGYGRADALKRVMGFSNDQFLSELRKRGFSVQDGARTNYVQTQQSLASTLNLNYLQDLFPNPTRSMEFRNELNRAVDHSAVSQRLKAQGYKYIAIGSGFPYFNFKSADIALDDVDGSTIFLSSLLELTPLQPDTALPTNLYEAKRRMIRRAFANIGAMAQPGGSPKFLFAHILVPHPPFVFTAAGEETPKLPGGYALSDGSHYFARGGTRESYRNGYVEQLQFTNKLLLATLDRILEGAKPQTIIILQGDHGPKLLLDQEKLEKTDLAEVAPILLAIKGLPPKTQIETPVNLYRNIFSDLFGDELPSLANKTYYSTWERPFEFIDVTAKAQ